MRYAETAALVRAAGKQRAEHLHRRRYADDAGPRISSARLTAQRSRISFDLSALARIYGRGRPPGHHHAGKAARAEKRRRRPRQHQSAVHE
ncbi:MAG: hypothetical protein ACLR4Z_01760 [Butyricicoccaceae bacterium]